MTSFPDPVKSTALVVYTPPQHPLVQARAYMEKMQNLFMERSFKAQIADAHLSPVYIWSFTDPSTGNDQEFFRTSSGDFLQKTEQGPRAPTVRSLVLAGAVPSPQIGPGLPARFPGTMEDLLDGVRENEPCTVRETIRTTINDISYNGLQPFNKTAKQISDGIGFLETRIDSRNEEETGSICIGMSHGLLKQLADQHGIEGMYAVQRKQGKDAFEHSAVIIECTDGYLLLDPRSHPDGRIFPIPFGPSVTIHGKTFTANKPGSQTPIFQTDPEEEFEYCTNIANGDDLVTKHFIMECPFVPPKDPAFPISAYYLDGPKAGRGSRTIWVSPLQAKFTFKNDTAEGSERTAIISFKDVLKDGFRSQLERFYVAGKPPTFNIDVGSLHAQLVQFVTNAGIVDEMFREIYSR